MKAKIETLPFEDRGIKLESETAEERTLLEDIWCRDGRVVVFTRLGDDNILIVIAPQAIEEIPNA